MIRILNIIALAAIFLVASSTALQAQTSQGVFEVQFQKREAKRREVIVRSMMFEEQVAEKFWPMYDQYRATAKIFHRRRFTMLNKLTDSIVGMSEEFAEEIVGKALALEMEQQSTKEEFISNLKSVLSKAQYFRYYQIETKLTARFKHRWTKKIPLAVTEGEAKKLEKLLQDQEKEEDKQKQEVVS